MKRIVKADMFIIPNGMREASSILDSERRIKEFNKVTGMRMKRSDLLAEVWVTSNHELGDNWQDHQGWKEICGIEDTDYPNLFPLYFPVNILGAFEEGDIIRVSPIGTDVIIELKCNQLGYRYRNFGRFEECLRDLPY